MKIFFQFIKIQHSYAYTKKQQLFILPSENLNANIKFTENFITMMMMTISNETLCFGNEEVKSVHALLCMYYN